MDSSISIYIYIDTILEELSERVHKSITETFFCWLVLRNRTRILWKGSTKKNIENNCLWHGQNQLANQPTKFGQWASNKPSTHSIYVINHLIKLLAKWFAKFTSCWLPFFFFLSFSFWTTNKIRSLFKLEHDSQTILIL